MNIELIGCNYSYRYYSIDAFCSLQKALGRKKVMLYAVAPQIWIDDKTASAPQDITYCFYQHGLLIDSVDLPSYGYRLGYTEQHLHDISMNYYKNAIDYCALIQVKKLLISIDPVFLGDIELHNSVYKEFLYNLDGYARNKGVKLIAKCSDHTFHDIMPLLISSSNSRIPYAYDAISRTPSLSKVFAIHGTPDIVLLHEPAQTIERNIEELNQLEFTGSVVVYQIQKNQAYCSCLPENSASFQSELLIQNHLSTEKE